MADLAFNGIPLPLVVDKLLLRGCNKLKIAVCSSQTWDSQADSMTLTECTVGSCPEDLFSTNHFQIVAMAAPKGDRLRIEVFSFVVGVVTQPLEAGESLTGDRDGDLGSETTL